MVISTYPSGQPKQIHLGCHKPSCKLSCPKRGRECGCKKELVIFTEGFALKELLNQVLLLGWILLFDLTKNDTPVYLVVEGKAKQITHQQQLFRFFLADVPFMQAFDVFEGILLHLSRTQVSCCDGLPQIRFSNRFLHSACCL